jgi:hypothetical protein
MVGAQGAAYPGRPVIAVGGWNGGDPRPIWSSSSITSQLGSEVFRSGRGNGEIAEWSAAHVTAVSIGGETMHDLDAGA